MRIWQQWRLPSIRSEQISGETLASMPKVYDKVSSANYNQISPL